MVSPYMLVSGNGEDDVQRVRLRVCKAASSALTSSVVLSQPQASVPLLSLPCPITASYCKMSVCLHSS